jgi:cytochrome c oxidase subunit 4
MANADAHDTVAAADGVQAHVGPTFNTYLAVFGALAVFTLLSFLFNAVLGQNMTSAALILIVAVFKAVLVGMFFMHLKFDWSKLYYIVFPVLILTVMMIIVLLPDIVVGWHTHPESLISQPEAQQVVPEQSRH